MSIVVYEETIVLKTAFIVHRLINQAGETWIEVVCPQDRRAILKPMLLDFGAHAGDRVFDTVMMPSNESAPLCFVVRITKPINALLQEILAAHAYRLEEYLNDQLKRETRFARLVADYYTGLNAQ